MTCVTVFSPDMVALSLLLGFGSARRAVLRVRCVLELVGYTEAQCLDAVDVGRKREERRDKPVRAIGLLRKTTSPGEGQERSARASAARGANQLRRVTESRPGSARDATVDLAWTDDISYTSADYICSTNTTELSLSLPQRAELESLLVTPPQGA